MFSLSRNTGLMTLMFSLSRNTSLMTLMFSLSRNTGLMTLMFSLSRNTGQTFVCDCKNRPQSERDRQKERERERKKKKKKKKRTKPTRQKKKRPTHFFLENTPNSQPFFEFVLVVFCRILVVSVYITITKFHVEIYMKNILFIFVSADQNVRP